MLILHKAKALLRTLPKVVLVLVGAVVLSGVVVASINVGGDMFGGESSVNLQKGLVGHWDMNGDANDRTPNGNHLSSVSSTFTNDRHGEQDSAYSFNGTLDAVLNTDNDVDHSGDLTYTAWVKPNDTYDLRGVVSMHWHPSPEANIGLCLRYGRFCSAVGFTDGSRETSYWGIAEPPVGEWTHVALVYEESINQQRLYVDGTFDAARDLTKEVNFSPRPLTVGRWAPSYSSYRYEGDMDDVRMYNRALSEAEISQLHDSYQPTVQISDSQKGLMGHWDMNGNANDRTPYGNHGTVEGATLTADRTGRNDSAYNFNGSSYISAPVSSNDRFTVSIWAKYDSLPSGHPGLFQAQNGGSTPSGTTSDKVIGAWVASGGDAWGRVIQADGSMQNLPTNGAAQTTAGTWHHYAYVADGSDYKLYLDGEFKKQVAYDGTIRDIDIAFIGQQGINAWAGAIDDVRIYNRALSEAEINQLHDSYQPTVQMSDLQKGLVGHWGMNRDAKDRTPYSNHGDVQGATLAANRLGRANSAYEFNGVDDYVDIGGVHVDTGKVTASAWIKLVSPSSTRNTIISSDEHRSGNEPQFVFATNASSNTYRSWINDDPTGWVSAEGGTLKIGVWVHYVFTYDGSFLRLYENGNEVASQEHSGAMNNNGGFKTIIGSRSSADIHWFGGLIDDVRVYNRALSAEEIELLHSSY